MVHELYLNKVVIIFYKVKKPLFLGHKTSHILTWFPLTSYTHLKDGEPRKSISLHIQV